MDEQGGSTLTAPGATWQRWAVWMARTGYSDLELSTFLTVRKIDRARAEAERSAPVVMLADALAVDAEFAGSSLVTLPLTLSAAAD
jgi:hypothetical protein